MDTAKLYATVCQRDKWLEQNWRSQAKKIPEIYNGDKKDEVPFNILFSNTETIVPALFSQAPQPSVRRRHGESRGDLPAMAAERMLSYLMDCNMADYPSFVDSAESAVLDAALPGMGQLRVRVVNKLPVIDFVAWDRFVWGYARRWEDVPWVAYVHDLTSEEIIRDFQLTGEKAQVFQTGVKETGEDSASNEGKTEATHQVFEVHHKQDRKVYYLVGALDDKLLREEDPPVKFSGFFPSPHPLQFVRSTTDTKPRPLYHLYERQAKELNSLTDRIRRVVNAIRVRGLYNGQLKELAQLFSGDDVENALIPAENPALLDRTGTLEGQIWMVPNEKLVLVLRELVLQREQVKSTIYEILGIGDILRGVSRASETLGAQEIKDKWGSLRITKLREKVALFLRDTLRLALEASAQVVEEPTWAAITAVPALPTIQKNTLLAAGQKVPMQSWGDILSVLRNDMQRSYHIDIETNTTVDAEAADDKAQIAQFMTGLGQALQGLGPIAQQGPEGFEAVKAIVIEFCKKFRIASDVMRVIENLQPPQQGGVPPEVEAMLKEMQKQLEQRAQQLDAQEKSLLSEKTLLDKQMLAAQKKLDEANLQLGEARLLHKQVSFIQQTAEKELGMREAGVQLAEKSAKTSLQEAEVATGVTSMLQDQIVPDMLSGMADGLGQVAASLKEALDGFAETMDKVAARQEEVLRIATAKPKRVRFVEQTDGSVLKEYLN